MVSTVNDRLGAVDRHLSPPTGAVMIIRRGFGAALERR